MSVFVAFPFQLSFLMSVQQQQQQQKKAFVKSSNSPELWPGRMLFFSGATEISFTDPLVVGRNVFSVTNDFVGGVAGYIQDVLCAMLDVVLDTLKGAVYVVVC